MNTSIKETNTSKRNKIYLIGEKTLSKNAIILAEKEFSDQVQTLPFPLTGTFVRSIKATAMAIKNRQIYISCLSLVIVKLYDPSSVSLQTHDTASI